MNNFTKEELCQLRESRCYHMDDSYPSNDALFRKLQFMIDNYWLPDNVDIIGTGQLLFHNKQSGNAIIPKISQQLELCQNVNEEKMYRIDWKILFGHRYPVIKPDYCNNQT